MSHLGANAWDRPEPLEESRVHSSFWGWPCKRKVLRPRHVGHDLPQLFLHHHRLQSQKQHNQIKTGAIGARTPEKQFYWCGNITKISISISIAHGSHHKHTMRERETGARCSKRRVRRFVTMGAALRSIFTTSTPDDHFQQHGKTTSKVTTSAP